MPVLTHHFIITSFHWDLETKICQAHLTEPFPMSSNHYLLPPLPHTVAIDFITGLPVLEGKNTIFTVIDCFSKSVYIVTLS